MTYFSLLESWMIKSSLLADEFNTLDVEKVGTPESRSHIENKINNVPANVLSRSTRGPGAPQAKTLIPGTIKDLGSVISKDASNSEKASAPTKKSNVNDNVDFIIHVDDQDATDDAPGEKRTLHDKGQEGQSSKDKISKSQRSNNKSLKDQSFDLKKNRTMNLRQDIEASPETYAGASIGKPYGDPDGYQTIGDGIYLMSTEQEAALMPKVTANNAQTLDTFLKPDSLKSFSKQTEADDVRIGTTKQMPEPSATTLPDILTHLDTNGAKKNDSGNNLVEAAPVGQGNRFSTDAVASSLAEATPASEGVKTSNEPVSINKEPSPAPEEEAPSNTEPSADVEGMTLSEIQALNSFEDKLGKEDKVIGKLILTKKVDKGQQEFVEKTNAMLQNENKQQLDNVFSKFQAEESAFVQKNPYVLDKPNLLEKIRNVTYKEIDATKREHLWRNDNIKVDKMPKLSGATKNASSEDAGTTKRGSVGTNSNVGIPKFVGRMKNVTYKDVGATKRGFLGTNDNIRVEKMYNSLLKEDDMISKGLNGNARAAVRKGIKHHQHNQEDEQVNEFLNFIENQDDKIDYDDFDEGADMGIEKKKKKKLKSKGKKKGALKKGKTRLMILEPSSELLTDTFSSKGMPQVLATDLKTFAGKNKKETKVREFSKGKTEKFGNSRKAKTHSKTTEASTKKIDAGKNNKNVLNTSKVNNQTQIIIASKNITKENFDSSKTNNLTHVKEKLPEKLTQKSVKTEDGSRHNDKFAILEMNVAKFGSNKNGVSGNVINKNNNKAVTMNKSDKAELKKVQSKPIKSPTAISVNKIVGRHSRRRPAFAKHCRNRKCKKIGHAARSQKAMKMEEGELRNSLFVSSKKGNNEPKRKSKKSKEDKEYYWHGTVKPETRQLPTDPSEQIRKLGRISNIMPVSFEESTSEGGVGQVVGDLNNIASFGSPSKEIPFGDESSDNSDPAAALKEYKEEIETIESGKHNRPAVNKIDENDISSTSFFSASKSNSGTLKDLEKEGVDPESNKMVKAALNQIDSKEIENMKGFVDADKTKTMALFDPNSLKPKLEEFDQDSLKEDSTGSEAEPGNEHETASDNEVANAIEAARMSGRPHKKHKMKIVLHLPDQIEGGSQEIRGKGSEAIGTIKDISMEYIKNKKESGLGQELAEDDEDTLEGILSKPTARLEQFHPSTTVTGSDFVPDTVMGKESNEWDAKDLEDKESAGLKEVASDQGRERNDNEPVDTLKSNKILSMIKNNEEFLQKTLGRHGSGEMTGVGNEGMEKFVGKANDDLGDSEGKSSQKGYERPMGKSVASILKNKQRKKNKNKSKQDKQKQDMELAMHETATPNIFADQIDYEHRSREVSQEMPTETVSQIKQILSADEHLMPINFLLEDQKALGKPGIGPMAVTNMKNRKAPTKPGSKTAKATKAANKKPPSSEFPTLSPDNPLSRLSPHIPLASFDHHYPPLGGLPPTSHKLRIQGGTIQGGSLSGGFISGGVVKGGDIEGGAILGGKVLGGVFKDGRMEEGTLYNGTVEGGLIQGGKIYGGEIKSGVMKGGQLKGGAILGGRLSGGEMDGGFLRSGEIRGGTLKSGSVEGGLLKGGTIEGGHLLGGVMLGGKLKGGVVRSGVIRGGVIEGGVVDGGVIEDGVVIKGGVVRGTFPTNVTAMMNESALDTDSGSDESKESISGKEKSDLTAKETEAVESTKPTTAQMYKINVDPSTTEHHIEQNIPADSSAKNHDDSQSNSDKPTDPPHINIIGAPESWPVENKDKGKQSDSEKPKVAPVTYSSAAPQKPKPAAVKPEPNQGGGSKVAPESKLKLYLDNLEKTKAEEVKPLVLQNNNGDEFIQLARDRSNAAAKSVMFRRPTPSSFHLVRTSGNGYVKNYGTTTRATIGKMFFYLRLVCLLS